MFQYKSDENGMILLIITFRKIDQQEIKQKTELLPNVNKFGHLNAHCWLNVRLSQIQKNTNHSCLKSEIIDRFMQVRCTFSISFFI
jgi:hypothetical protein